MSASRLGQTLTLFGAVLLTALVGCTQSVPQTTGAASLTPASADRLLGVWSLEDYRDTAQQGQISFPCGENATGQIVYTSVGRMAVHLMRRSADPAQAVSQCNAYWGNYTVDAEAQTVTHHVLGGAMTGLSRPDLVRGFRFEGEDRVVLSEGRSRRLTWVRVR